MSKEITQTIITADPGGEQLVQFARELAYELVDQRLTRSQIRNIFTEARKIEALWESNSDNALRRLNMLKPKLAYTYQRNKEKLDMSKLRDTLCWAIDSINEAKSPEEKKARLDRFMDLFEAILAYHHAAGGRN